MTESKTKYKSYKIQGRTVNLIPRKDGRFNLQIEGQRGVAGSTAAISAKEAKEMLERLADFPLEEKTLAEDYDEDGVLTVKEYNTIVNNEEIVEYPGEIVLENIPQPDPRTPIFMDIYGVKEEKPKIRIEEKIIYETGESFISFEGAGFGLKYNPEEINPFSNEEYDSSILDTEVVFDNPEITEAVNEALNDEMLETENEIQPKGKTGKITVRDLIKIKASNLLEKTEYKMLGGGARLKRFGTVVSGAADLSLDWATDKIVSHSLKQMQTALTEIQYEARKDILLGKPIGFINQYGPLLAVNKISSIYSKSREQQAEKFANKRFEYVKKSQKINNYALRRAQEPIVHRIRTEELKPLQEEYSKIMSQLEQADQRRESLNIQLSQIKESSWMKITDAQIESQRRKAAKERNAEELSRINKIAKEREQLKAQAAKLKEEYSSLPTLAKMRPKIAELKTKTAATERKISEAYSSIPEGFKPPFTTNEDYKYKSKIVSLFGQRLHAVVLNGRAEKEGIAYGRSTYLRV